jgi:hypothetical protein
MTTVDEAFPVIEATSSTSPQEETPSAAVEEGGGAQDDQAPASAVSVALSQDATHPAAADHPTEDPIALAYRHGVEAKAAGNRRTALPGEYRGAAHTKRADAWFAGYDGKPMPRDDENFELHGE